MDNVDRSPTKSVDAPNAMGRWNATRCIGTQATTFFAILAMAALAGCQVRKDELEMTPRGGKP